MSDSRFALDTNILVYALDRQAGHRHVLARGIIDRAVLLDCWLTLQSISEFYFAVTRKRIAAIEQAHDQATDWLEMFHTASPSIHAVRSALALSASGRASYWDALLVATAAEAGCTAILTEDLADGSSLAGVRVINPFDGTALAPAAEAQLTGEQ